MHDLASRALTYQILLVDMVFWFLVLFMLFVYAAQFLVQRPPVSTAVWLVGRRFGNIALIGFVLNALPRAGYAGAIGDDWIAAAFQPIAYLVICLICFVGGYLLAWLIERISNSSTRDARVAETSFDPS